ARLRLGWRHRGRRLLQGGRDAGCSRAEACRLLFSCVRDTGGRDRSRTEREERREGHDGDATANGHLSLSSHVELTPVFGGDGLMEESANDTRRFPASRPLQPCERGETLQIGSTSVRATDVTTPPQRRHSRKPHPTRTRTECPRFARPATTFASTERQ